jgi:hypothetical protein
MAIASITRQAVVKALLPELSVEQRAQRRQEYLDRGYVECSISGCGALASPDYIVNLASLGQVALCPNTRRHQSMLGPTAWNELSARYFGALSALRDGIQAAVTNSAPAEEAPVEETVTDPAPAEAPAKKRGKRS